MNGRQRFLCHFCGDELRDSQVKIEQDGLTEQLYLTARCHGMMDEICLEYAVFQPHRRMDVIFFQDRPRPEECH
jgi:hypothetical protein